jgi:MFS family permease
MLYVLGVLLLGLLLLDYRLRMAEGWHKVFAIVIVLGFYGLVARWLRINRGALAREELKKHPPLSSHSPGGMCGCDK